MKECRWSRVL